MLKNKKGQGMTEYVVIIAAVIAVFVVMWPTIKTALTTKGGEVVSNINSSVIK